jgi:hypothetical protein
MNSTAEKLENESVVAVLPGRGGNEEAELSRSVSAVELEAESIIIENDAEYGTAAEFGRKLKQMSSEVAAFFKPMKEAANRAHREVCDREKVMLNPLIRAESTLKRTMGDYSLRKERERQAAEAEARRLAMEEAERKLAEAVRAEESGDDVAARGAMLEAQMADSMSRSMHVSAPAPKAEGISQSKDWQITRIDAPKVPVVFNGMELRPVDEKAVIRIIRASKGQISIPGVEYVETIKTSIRK